MAMQATAARDGRGSSGRAGCQPAAVRRIWLYADSCMNAPAICAHGLAVSETSNGGTHTHAVSATDTCLLVSLALQSCGGGSCVVIDVVSVGVTVSSMVTVGRRRCRCMAEPGCRRKAHSSQPSRQMKPASSLAHVRARVGERCANTAFFFNHISRECTLD